MGELSHTVGGDNNLVSFKSAARVPITSLKAHFQPKQDLHGYSKPWPAGGGKNLFGSSFVNGNVDMSTGGITKSAASFPNRIVSDYVFLAAGTYTFSIAETKQVTIYFYTADSKSFVSSEGLSNWVNAPRTFTITENRYAIFVVKNANNSNLSPSDVTNIQVEKASAATSYEPYENICPIEGWNSASVTRTGKNISRITGYGTQNGDNVNGPFYATNAYGTSINSTSFSIPDTPLVVTQSQWPNTSAIYNYANGYLTVFVDNLEFDKYYDVSFKITDIKNNPLNASLSSIQLLIPKGSAYSSYKTIGNTVFFRNVKWERYANKPTRSNFEIRNCGMSFTLSEFMVTKVNTNDGVFEPYCGEVIPVTFPVAGKNLFDASAQYQVNYLIYDDATNFFTNDTEDTRTTFEIYCEGWNDNTRIGSFFVRYEAPTGYFTSTFTVNDAFKDMDNLRVKHNGTKRDFSIRVPMQLIVGQTYTFSMQITGNDPTTVGGVSFGNIQIELGDGATTYEPYSADNTFYGGYVDVAAKEVVAEYGILDLGSLTWSLYSNNTNRQAWYAWANGLKSKTGSDEIANCYSTIFTPTTRAALWKPYHMCTPNYASLNLLIFFNPDQYNDGIEVQNAVNGIPLIYELLEPVHYPISSSQITTLLGPNNFYSNTNSTTEVSYAIHDTAPIRAAKHRIAANEPHIETTDGSIAHFETDMAAPLKECKVYFTPKQNFNGYSKPWVGGTGKNLWDNNNVIYGTWTSADGTINVNNWGCRTPDIEVTPGDVYTVFYNGEIPYSASIIELDENKNFILRTHRPWAGASSPSALTVTIGTNTRYCYVQTYSNTGEEMNLSLLVTYKIQFEKGSTATAYEPYENICPITGWTGLQVHSAGKNLLRLPVMTRTYNGITWTLHEDGGIDVDGTSSAQYAFMSKWNDESQHKDFLLKAGTYVLSGNNNKLAAIYLVARDGSTSANIGSLSKYYTYSTFTLAQDTLVGFQAAVADTDGEVHFTFRPQLELVELSEYESPNYDTIDVDWEDDFGTIYGGYVDLVSGELVSNWMTYDLSSFYWMNRGTGNNKKILYTELPSGYGYTTDCPLVSERYPTIGYIGGIGDLSDVDSMDDGFRWYYNTYNMNPISVYLVAGINETPQGLLAAKSSTPITYSLSSQTIKTFKSQNNIWSNANGNVSVKYYTRK